LTDMFQSVGLYCSNFSILCLIIFIFTYNG
jgi:hypothetical protein